MTRYSTTKLLTDIAVSCRCIMAWTDSLESADYVGDTIIRSAVERKFEIVGEALNRLARSDPATFQRIAERRQIIGFRNRLAHGYDELNHRLVLEIARTSVPRLEAEVSQLLEEQ